MTPRERTVLRAIAKALRGGSCADMDALALSYEMPYAYEYFITTKLRAAIFLTALANDVPEKKKNDVDTHKIEP